MSAVQHFFPSNALATALKKAPPRTVKECIKQADENLRLIAEACVEHVDRGLDLLEVLVGRWPEAPEEGYLDSVYDAALRMVGVASVAHLTHFDVAVKSLCEVVDGLRQRQLWDRDPVEVHVRAMRLLRSPQDLAGGEQAVLAGLNKVRERFRHRPANPPPPRKD